MLCDDIIANKVLPGSYPGFSAVQRSIQIASKFSLSADFASAADGLVNNIKQLERIAPFCRLPAPVCWFELAQQDRPHFMRAPTHYAEFQSAPKRVGFLTIATDPTKLWEWTTILCWLLHSDPGPKFIKLYEDNGQAYSRINASAITVRYNTKDGFEPHTDELSQYVTVHIAPFTPSIVKDELKNSTSKLSKIMLSDWGGEIRYLFAVLGLFNARNVMETESVVWTQKKARARQSTGKLPLCDHTILKIRAMHRRSFVGERGKGTCDDIRKHFVTGHWKTRRTGLFWWNPFWRGQESKGTMTHDYVVSP